MGLRLILFIRPVHRRDHAAARPGNPAQLLHGRLCFLKRHMIQHVHAYHRVKSVILISGFHHPGCPEIPVIPFLFQQIRGDLRRLRGNIKTGYGEPVRGQLQGEQPAAAAGIAYRYRPALMQVPDHRIRRQVTLFHISRDPLLVCCFPDFIPIHHITRRLLVTERKASVTN